MNWRLMASSSMLSVVREYLATFRPTRVPLSALAAGYSSGTYSGNTVFVLPAPSQMPALIPIVHMGKVQFRQQWLQRVKNARMAPSASVLLASPFFCSTSCVQGHAHMADSAWQRVNMLPRKSDQLVLTVAPRSGTTQWHVLLLS